MDDRFVHPKERLYFALLVILSVLLYLAMIISVVGILYLLGGAALALIATGLFIGQIRGNGVRVTPRGHLKWRTLLAPGMFMPLLGQAYSRACEYTCDRYAAAVSPQGAVAGLLVLASGKRLYRHVNPQLFRQQQDDFGFWTWLAEKFATHPHLPKRLAAVEAALGNTNP